MRISNTYNELKFYFEDELALQKAVDERKIKWKADNNPEHLTQNKLDEAKIEGLKVKRSRIVSELGEDIGVTKQKQTKKNKKLWNDM